MINAAVAAIRAGDVIGVPTDTVYGLAADPLNPDAVLEIFDLKGRPDHKPIGVLVATVDQAMEIGEIHGEAHRLALDHWPGALTLVVTPRVVLAEGVGDSQRRTVGVRVPDHPVARELLEATGPLGVTSANRSGEPAVMDEVAARRVLGDGVIVYLAGTSPGGEASTVVDATGEKITVLRMGPVQV